MLQDLAKISLNVNDIIDIIGGVWLDDLANLGGKMSQLKKPEYFANVPVAKLPRLCGQTITINQGNSMVGCIVMAFEVLPIEASDKNGKEWALVLHLNIIKMPSITYCLDPAGTNRACGWFKNPNDRVAPMEVVLPNL